MQDDASKDAYKRDMEPSNALPPDAAEVLARGGTILTGNQRAARTLRLAFDLASRTTGLASWEPPHIFAWDAWTSQLWRQLLIKGGSGKLLLNRTQELALWRSVIAADPSSTSLQSVESLATMAAGAWQLLCAYRGQSRLKKLGISEDTRTFQRWAESFLRRCNSNACLSQSELEDVLAETIKTGRLKPFTKQLLLIGFEGEPPAQKALLTALESSGVEIRAQPIAPLAGRRYLAAPQTLEEELAAAAHWLRAHLEAAPDARIAVIHPDIEADRGEIDRVFRQILAPETQSIARSVAVGPFEFSLGQPLLHAPMVAVALRLLHWIAGALPIESIGHILLSPYFGPASEFDSRAEFDAFELRRSRLLRPELNLAAFLSQVEGSRRASRLRTLTSQLHALHRTAAKLLPDGARQKSHADWADNVRELLQAAGWASDRPANTIEFQVRRKWEGALDEFATLDFEGTRPTFLEVLDRLEGILRRTLFAPESRDAPIQIMSPNEAAGSRFDALYFLRCSDLAWPATPGTNPLLGWRLQRDLNMPGSDSERDLTHAKTVTDRLAACAPVVVFSYARETPEGHQRPSPLLAGLALEPIPISPVPAGANPVALEEIEDPGDIPLADPKVRGGSHILKLQAACGFRAFAEVRLNSTPLDILEPGMDAPERGSVVHTAMAHLWNDLGTQAALRVLTPAQRAAQLDRAIDAALERSSTAAVSPWDTAYLDIQRERLRRLIHPWLELELQRPPFSIKSSEERFVDRQIGPLMLTIRVDRIDTVLDPEGESRGEVLLDYKTGDARPGHWQGERPDDPQLPLYAVLSEPGTLAAVGFVRLRPGKEMGLQGFADDKALLPRPARHAFASLEAQVADWHRVLTSLAEDFAAGDARVRPKAYPNTCEFCAQRILCRVDPALLDGDDDLDDPEQAHG